MRRLLFGLSLSLAACPKPTDSTPMIAVSPGAAARAARFSRFRAGQPAAGADAGAAANAHAHALAKGQELGGPNATGKPGDLVLENDEVVFVIDGFGTGSGFAESGGNLIDAADARTRKDELGQLFTYFGTFPRQGVYTTIDTKDDADGSAVVVAKGKELWDDEIDVVTTYRLAAGDRALLIETKLTNHGKTKKTGFGLGDAIQWGAAEKTAPGKPLGFKGPSTGPYIGGIGRATSYAITSTEGEIEAISGGAWTDTRQVKDVTIDAGATVSYARVFVVGQRADSASIVAELTRASGGEVGAVEIALEGKNGKAVNAPAGAKAWLGTAQNPEILTLVASGDGATIAGEVPPGKWKVSFGPSVGRNGDGKLVDVDVKAGAVASAKLAVSEPTSTMLGPCDAPCKLTIEGIAPTTSPELGPAHAAGPARNQVTLVPREKIELPLPPGRYRVTASRGPEYGLDVREIDVPRAEKELAFAPPRILLTTGYVGVDFHQHTILSADSPVATRDRVIANAAEGVEVAVATEHNVVADFTPIAKELGLSPYLVSIAGDELTSDASKKPWGHANVWPLPVRSDRARGGAVVVRDRMPKDIFAELRALPGGPRVVAINHPRTKDNGYFELLGFDTAKATSADPMYDASFDALEIWSGRHGAGRERVLLDWFALLKAGHPVTPIAATDTHGVVGQEAGYPRTYVRVEKDDNLESWDASRTADLVKGVRERRDVVITNGPFMTVTANGTGIGGVARAKRGNVEVKIHARGTPWNGIDACQIRRAKDDEVQKVVLSPTGDATLTLTAKSDDVFVVIVSGSKPMRPVLGGDDDDEIKPWGMSGPIWIDADGDGKSLGR